MTVQPCSPSRPIQVAARGRELVVDIHAHLHVAAAVAVVGRENAGPPPAVADFSSPASDAVNARQFAAIADVLASAEARLPDMDRLGVDVQALSPSPGQFYYHLDAELARSAARVINDGIAAEVAKAPDRFVGMGTVPLQNAGMAVAELRRCVRDLDLRGVEINANVDGRDLDDPTLRPFWAAAEELGTLVFIHPLGFTEGRRLRDHYFNNLIGNPLEATLAIGHLIFGGVLDRHPGLRICVAHGGGYLPGYWGRMDHGWRAREDCRAGCEHPPSSYLRRLWLDTLVFDRDQLDSLVRTHGADRLCLGSDYPFDMAEPDPVGFHQGLDENDRAKILGLNAAALLGLHVAGGRA
ncbi:amidohydrolase family protein [Sphingomonas sp.]|jgi:aminocarboxymuconate-semialdehyde decarboxylase|uniref:amidohydrolase family protein n=1 Tax=Sphingomonas sp. TaxID=28214 RepID=UPI002D7EF782|nr:amidohydrolase family protein [Sphingomonas sp.]HEU0045409.1 amidohydrolase family protein [Sphingomonas sp.]